MNLQFLINIKPKRVKVSFFDADTGQLLGMKKINADELPGSFNKPTFLEWEGTNWRVLKATPLHSKEYMLDNKLSLYVQQPSLIDTKKMGYHIATLCEELPPLSKEVLFNDFSFDIIKDEWQQLELLPASLLPVLKEEMVKVESILYPGNTINVLQGYPERYLRKRIPRDNPAITADDFFKLAGITRKGSIHIINHGHVKDGFAFETPHHVYYGIINKCYIKDLCLYTFDCVDEELYTIFSAYDFLLADWCSGKIIMA